MGTEAQPFAVFDIDGTLIRWQLYHAVVDRLAKKNLLGSSASEQLHDARMVWKRREHPTAFRQYELSLIEIYESALPILTPKQFDQVVDEIATEYKEQIYTFTRDLAKSLKDKGYVLIAISGSHEELVGHIARQYNFDIWVGSRYERRNNMFTGKKFVASSDKQTTLEALIEKENLSLKGSVGVGDSHSDAKFLKLVEQPIAFNPDQDLFKVARENKWMVVIERKNMVYTLKEHDGSYLLAQTNI